MYFFIVCNYLILMLLAADFVSRKGKLTLTGNKLHYYVVRKAILFFKQKTTQKNKYSVYVCVYLNFAPHGISSHQFNHVL